MVSFIDFGPTVLSLAGLAPDGRLDGTAFLGEFAGEPRRYAFVHADRMDTIYDTQRAVTDGRFKYIYHAFDGREQLFDLDNDPGETKNLTGARLAAWRARMVRHLAMRGPQWVINGKLAIRRKPIRIGPNYPRAK